MITSARYPVGPTLKAATSPASKPATASRIEAAVREVATLRRVARYGHNVEASYDAAQTTTTNARHWQNADGKAADEANDPFVRRTLRNRSRYECDEGNSWATGIVDTLALDTIGTGPRLQVTVDGNPDGAALIERRFGEWARSVGLRNKLRLMRRSKAVSGEAFAKLFTNRRRPSWGVQLDLRVYEADQVSTPTAIFDPTRAVDGIDFDPESGDPATYHLLNQHPGAAWATIEADPVDASEMVHLYKQLRPGQHRGIPELTTSLPLFAWLREYSLATLSAAKIAAMISAVIEADGPRVTYDENGNPVDSNHDPSVEAFDFMDLDYQAIAAMPYGWKLHQMRAEQPVNTHESFVRSILTEAARPVSMPYVIAAGDASRHNFASARMDLQTYALSIIDERAYFEHNCLDRVFAAWLDEALLVDGYLDDVGDVLDIQHGWIWTSRGHVDPDKVSKANDRDLRNGTKRRGRIYSEQGLDIDEEDRKAAAECGLSVEDYRRRVSDQLFAATDAATVAASADNIDLREAVQDTISELQAELSI